MSVISGEVSFANSPIYGINGSIFVFSARNFSGQNFPKP